VRGRGKSAEARDFDERARLVRAARTRGDLVAITAGGTATRVLNSWL
jgi:hypothetical protein